MLIIALTGGIGSGKTTVSDIFKSNGVPIIDTDVIAREIVAHGKPAYFEIIKTFGNEILSSEKNIDRKKLSEIIFSSKNKRLQLENILHPIIWNKVNRQIASLKSSKTPYPYCIIVVPLLFESQADNNSVNFDRILVIDTDKELQIKRVKNRDCQDESMIKNIIDSQVSRQTRTKVADDIILNTGDLESLNNEVMNLHQKYQQLSMK